MDKIIELLRKFQMPTFADLLEKYKAVISYLFFGGCATLINIGTYIICFDMFNIGNMTSNVIAWVTAVIFAFFTNKLWVFESKSFDGKVFFWEMFSFFGCRLLTLVVDLAIMYVGVDVMHWNEILFKVIANIVVIILNYVASKLIIFKKKDTMETEQ